MLKSKILEYYDWFKVQKFLSNAMGFDDEYFHDYHKIVGGDYKNFWHVWLDTVDNDVHNDCWSTVYLGNNEDWVDYVREKRGDWVEPLVEALNELQKYVGKDSIVIYYSW